MDTSIEGIATSGAVLVIDRERLSPRNPRGRPLLPACVGDRYDWGVVNADAEALAVALLSRVTDMDNALRLRQTFLHAVVAQWPHGQDWEIHDKWIAGWVAGQLLCEQIADSHGKNGALGGGFLPDEI